MIPSIPSTSDIEAVVFPPIKAPDPLDALEAAEGVCAQEEDQ